MHRYVPLVIIFSLFFSGFTAAQSVEDMPKRKLVVGTKVTPPFVIKDADGRYSGISIELWQKIADEQGLDFEYRETDLAGLIDGLKDGSLDVSVAALTVTAERDDKTLAVTLDGLIDNVLAKINAVPGARFTEAEILAKHSRVFVGLLMHALQPSGTIQGCVVLPGKRLLP